MTLSYTAGYDNRGALQSKRGTVTVFGEQAVLALLRKCGCLRQQKEGQAPVRLHLWRPDMQYHATAAATAAALVPLL